MRFPQVAMLYRLARYRLAASLRRARTSKRALPFSRELQASAGFDVRARLKLAAKQNVDRMVLQTTNAAPVCLPCRDCRSHTESHVGCLRRCPKTPSTGPRTSSGGLVRLSVGVQPKDADSVRSANVLPQP